jgi:hypothetical protein
MKIFAENWAIKNQLLSFKRTKKSFLKKTEVVQTILLAITLKCSVSCSNGAT